MVPRIGTFAAVLIGLIGLVSAAPGDAEKPSTAIKTLLDTQAACWNKKDLDGFLVAYWHDPAVVFLSGGTRSDGFEALKTRYHNRYQAEGREMGHLDFDGIEIQSLGPDSAFARGRWKLTMADGKVSGGLFTLILRKLPEGWRIVHDHTSVAA